MVSPDPAGEPQSFLLSDGDIWFGYLEALCISHASKHSLAALTALSVGQKIRKQHNGVSLVCEKLIPDRLGQQQHSELPNRPGLIIMKLPPFSLQSRTCLVVTNDSVF